MKDTFTTWREFLACVYKLDGNCNPVGRIEIKELAPGILRMTIEADLIVQFQQFPLSDEDIPF